MLLAVQQAFFAQRTTTTLKTIHAAMTINEPRKSAGPLSNWTNRFPSASKYSSVLRGCSSLDLYWSFSTSESDVRYHCWKKGAPISVKEYTRLCPLAVPAPTYRWLPRQWCATNRLWRPAHWYMYMTRLRCAHVNTTAIRVLPCFCQRHSTMYLEQAKHCWREPLKALPPHGKVRVIVFTFAFSFRTLFCSWLPRTFRCRKTRLWSSIPPRPGPW